MACNAAWALSGSTVSVRERAGSRLRRPTLKAAKEIPSFFWFIFCTQVRQTGSRCTLSLLTAHISRYARLVWLGDSMG